MSKRLPLAKIPKAGKGMKGHLGQPDHSDSSAACLGRLREEVKSRKDRAPAANRPFLLFRFQRPGGATMSIVFVATELRRRKSAPRHAQPFVFNSSVAKGLLILSLMALRPPDGWLAPFEHHLAERGRVGPQSPRRENRIRHEGHRAEGREHRTFSSGGNDEYGWVGELFSAAGSKAILSLRRRTST